jgi:hypothetical protein
MNRSLERYLEYRKLLARQAKAQSPRVASGRGHEGAPIARSYRLDRAADQAEAMRWTLRAVRTHGSA